LTLSAALAATLITATGASAAVPLTLSLETVRAGMAMLAGQTAGIVSTQAFTLAQGALHAMFIAKVKCAAAVVLAVVTLGLGTGYVAHRAIADGRDGQPIARQDPKKENNQKDDGQQNQKDDGQQNQNEGQVIHVPDLYEFLVQEREQRKVAASVTGIVQTVDAKKINVLVARGEPDGKTFDLAKDVKVVKREGRETKEAKLADVQAKARVNLILDDAKKTVHKIEIIGVRREGGEGERRPDEGNAFRGQVSEVDAAKKTITFEMGGREQPATTKTFDLAKDVKVTIRTGRRTADGKLEDIKAKTWVVARLDKTRKVVESIEISISTTAVGSVSEISDKSITLTSGREEIKSVTYPLAKDVKVQYWLPGATDRRDKGGDAKALKLADVLEKTNVTVQLDDDLKVVQAIEVHLPQFRGTVGDVDAKKGTLTLKALRGDDLSVTVSKDARILIDGKAGSLDKVAAGAEVQVILSPNRMQVLSLQTPLPQRREE
jgi:hypothetical protein